MAWAACGSPGSRTSADPDGRIANGVFPGVPALSQHSRAGFVAPSPPTWATTAHHGAQGQRWQSLAPPAPTIEPVPPCARASAASGAAEYRPLARFLRAGDPSQLAIEPRSAARAGASAAVDRPGRRYSRPVHGWHSRRRSRHRTHRPRRAHTTRPRRAGHLCRCRFMQTSSLA